MPFTFSHPGAVLPLNFLPKKYFSMTALVIGSMAPDFEYFFRMRAQSYYSHRWSGMFWFDLPLVIVLAFVFHGIVRNTLIDHLPGILARRFQIFKSFSWKQHFKKYYFVVIVSAVIGTSSHILWDAFAHERGIFETDIGSLKEFYAISFRHRFATYNLLQLVSSVAGILIVLFAVFRLPAAKNFRSETPVLPFWIFIFSVMTIILGIRIFDGFNIRLYRDTVMTLISGGLIGLLLASLIFRLKRK
ncbi:MAG: DUF4184 family protein [Bacteroidetes bacterium]|nr:DUF4184 family protein [Bacteroidota bacterium]